MISDEPPLPGAPTPGGDKGRSHTLAEYSLEELIARWEEFFGEQGLESAIISLADRYPEERTLKVSFQDLNRFDTDMSIHLLRAPLNVLAAGEEAVRRIVPPTEEAVEIHLRVTGLPRDSRIQIRDLRAKHLGRFIAVEGLVRKATEVRPMVVDATFQCLRCGTVIKEPQEGQAFREPLECYEDQGGCKRSASATKFKLLGEASRYLDTQKIEIQEAPEGLRGGEEPQRLSGFMEDDLTGKITPGMRVILSGILRSTQRGKPGQKSTLFDIFLDTNSLEFEQREFEEIEVTEADAARIEAEAAQPDIFNKIVASIAPSIYGLTTEKEALALQLFSGVPKVMPDQRRIRGDIHVLLVGDPGCLEADERVILANGTIAKIGNMGASHLQPIRCQVRLGTGSGRTGWATKFHRHEDQAIIEIVTESGKSIRGTHNHPLLVWNPSTRSSEWRRLDALRIGDRLRVAPSIRCWKEGLVRTGWTTPKTREKRPKVKVPRVVDEKLAAILGYVLGDGWVHKAGVAFCVADSELDLVPRLSDLFSDVFGIRPSRLPREGRITRFSIYRRTIIGWLWHIRVKRVPDSILQSRNSVVSSFLRWLFEADGSCFTGGRGRTAISLRSAEIELLRDVQILLLRWGIHSRILWELAPRPHMHRGAEVRSGPSGSLVIRQTESILRFAKYVGFESAKKKERLDQVVEYVSSRTRRWHLQMSERIVSIRPAGRATVYDIEVPGPQRFIANGIISHNTAKSELLSYMSRLSPRGIYATGKAATAAGLTAAAVRDEFGEGRWTLEAGALVLADKGLACIDEIDKMNPQDRAAIHEALEQQRISVAKAGITAVLQARCAVLGAANPKFGRFDETKYIAEQIDLPPTLLSRFDVIFSIIDKPDAPKDAKLADHILGGHLVGEWLRRKEEGKEVPEANLEFIEVYAPHFDPTFFRKYVAYAKRVSPVMAPEAVDAIRTKYLEIRKMGEPEGASVPITPRQLEAIIRLAEASARARLSPKVEIQDAERAVRITEAWMRRVAGEEGRFDIDIVQVGISRSQREQILILREVIGTLSEQGPGGSADYEDIVKVAEERGVPKVSVDQWLKRWSQEGEVYSPGKNKYKLVERL